MSEEMNAVAVMDNPVGTSPKPLIREDGEKHATIVSNTDTTHFDSYIFTPLQRNYLVFKRAVDFIISLIALIILAIPFLIIAISQKIVSPKEPVFFVQNRVGKDGKIIKVLKFRSMKSSAPHDCPTKDFNECEQYITKWGRFLRDSSIDELPQLFQVLTGKMSLIGPRPLIPLEESVHKMREQAGVYQLRPGMTGWAQVNGRDLVEDNEKVEHDIEYLKSVCLKFDFKIFILTIKKVVTKADIEEGQVTVKNKL